MTASREKTEASRDPTSTRSSASSRRRWLRAVGFTGTLAAAGCLDLPTEGGHTDDETDAIHPEHDTREVRVETPEGESLGSVTAAIADTPEGESLGSVTAAIADTPERRYTGLSDTESLPEDRGMLFVYESVGARTFVMREMSFGIDVVYADADGVITTIHHAPAPGPEEDGEKQRYPGRGQYVLEVGYRWSADRGVDVGDVLRFGSVEPAGGDG